MRPKTLMFIFATIGSVVGGYIPALWGSSAFSLTSLFMGSLGAIAGVWIVFKMQGY